MDIRSLLRDSAMDGCISNMRAKGHLASDANTIARFCSWGFGLSASSVSLVQGWQAMQVGCVGSCLTIPGRTLTLITVGMITQWLLGAVILHSVHVRYGQDRLPGPCGQLCDLLIPVLAGVAYGWFCPQYVLHVTPVASLAPGFSAFLVLGASVPSILFLGMTQQSMLPAPPQCPACHYILFYATHHRCPECGRTFRLNEIDTSAVAIDGRGILQPNPGVTDHIRWPLPEKTRHQRNWHRLRHPVTALLIATYGILVFNVAAFRLNSPGAWGICVIAGAALLTQAIALVMVLRLDVRQQILRRGLAGQACLLGIVTNWLILLNMTLRLFH